MTAKFKKPAFALGEKLRTTRIKNLSGLNSERIGDLVFIGSEPLREKFWEITKKKNYHE